MSAVAERLSAALADRYRVERELGAGGMATVYLAEDLKHKRKVALKVLKPELAAVLGAERFVQEITTTASLQHPHILPLFDSGTADGFLYYVMPFIQGETVREKLNRETQLGVDEAVKIAIEVADALHYAHTQGVIHRDIKPENILLANGRPMVADFGIALAVSAAAGGRMTETGLSLGTPHYMSPEQATADRTITARSDIYSLAAVLYEMLTGEPPHMGTSAQQIIMKIIAEPVKAATELRKSVPPHVSMALTKALEKLPADRFESARAFAEALNDTAFTSASSTRPTTGTRAVYRRRATIAALTVLAVASGALLDRALDRDAVPSSPVVRLRVTPPLRMEIDFYTANAIALSPDGRMLALSVRDDGLGTRRIYLRRIDRLDADLVEGSEGGATPFFSPDSRTLGFISVADGRIRKVPVNGGPVTTISNRGATARLTPAWSDDGQVYFNGTDFRLYRADANGTGDAVLVGDSTYTVTYDSGHLPSVLAYPSVIPGSRKLIVSLCAEGVLRGSAECAGSLRIIDARTGAITRLAVPGTRGWYVDGHLVVLDGDGSLSAVAFDAQSGSVRSEPVALLTGLGRAVVRRPQLDVSRSGSLAYVDNSGQSERTVVEVDRAGRERTVVSEPGTYLWVRLSPDETRLLMVKDGRETSGSQLHVYDRRSETMLPLTFAGLNQRASWSPTGKQIVFSSARDSASDIWTVPADGSAPPSPIAKGKDVVQLSATFWTRDGQWIIIDGLADVGGSAGADDIFALPANGQGSLRPLVATPANEQDGEVSPDGRFLAYVSEDAGYPQVYVQPFLQPGGRTLVSVGPAIEPAWVSPNELVYSSMATDSLVLARLTVGATVSVSRAGILDRSRYALGTPAWREYDVSRDGKRFIFSRPLTPPRVQDVTVVVNWMDEIRAAIAAARVRQ